MIDRSSFSNRPLGRARLPRTMCCGDGILREFLCLAARAEDANLIAARTLRYVQIAHGAAYVFIYH